MKMVWDSKKIGNQWSLNLFNVMNLKQEFCSGLTKLLTYTRRFLKHKVSQSYRKQLEKYFFILFYVLFFCLHGYLIQLVWNTFFMAINYTYNELNTFNELTMKGLLHGLRIDNVLLFCNQYFFLDIFCNKVGMKLKRYYCLGQIFI